MTIIPIGNITPNGGNRKNGGELTLISSVKTDGILEPVIVYKEEGDEKFTIAAGHRRYASAKAYGIEDIPCIVLPKEKAIRAASIENLDRENLTPADVAESILSMHACGYSNNEIALITKHTKNQVARIIKLEDCIPEVRESLRKGDISLEIALEYAPYSKEIQKDVYKNFSKATWCKANDIRNALNRRLGITLKECSDLFFRSTLGCGVSCLSCEKNLACNGVLFSEGVTKEESVCTSKEDWLRKYTELAKSLGLRYQDVEGLKDYGYAEGIKAPNRGKEEPTCWKNCDKGLSLQGEICYFGGEYICPSYIREMSEKEKELKDSLDKEKAQLQCLLDNAEKYISRAMYQSIARAIVKAVEPFSEPLKKRFSKLIEENLYSHEAMDWPLEVKIIKAMFYDEPGRIDATCISFDIKGDKDIKKIFKKYTDHMKTPELKAEIDKLYLTAQKIKDIYKEIEKEQSKEAKS